MNRTRLTAEQYTLLNQMASGEMTIQEFRSFDQRQLYGMHKRGLFVLDRNLHPKVTREGLRVFDAQPKYRNNAGSAVKYVGLSAIRVNGNGNGRK